MEIALSTHTGEADVVTPISASDELKRLENPRARLPQNFSAHPDLEAGYREAIRTGEEACIQKFQRQSLRRNYTFRHHMPLAKIKAELDPAFFDTAFKFTIERHPFDRMVSLAYWKRRNSSAEDIGRTVDELLDARILNNVDSYSLEGYPAVDHFVRYEAMREGVEVVGRKIGAPDLWNELPQTKHEHRTDRRPAAEILTDRQKRRIVRQCRKEFELFGYET